MSTLIPPGTMLGRCLIGEVIGKGSMGVVYNGFHTTLDLPVAVKVLDAPWLGPETREWLDRFRREAKLAARLNHPGLVRVFDFGQERDTPYLVMELVHGKTLDTVILERDPMDEHLALRIVGQIAVSLHAAHQAGIIHRDLKPANIMIDSSGGLKIADFGLARDPHSAAITHPSGIAGTPHYMAPEAIESGGITDHRVDIYALGVILYRLLYGRLPYKGTLHQVMSGHLTGQPDWSLPDHRRLSSGSLYLARRLLEKWPEKRIQNAIEVVQACRELLARLDEQGRIQKEIEARPTKAGESSSSRLAQTIRDRLRVEAPLANGKVILRATSLERLVSFLLLALLTLLVLSRL